MSEEKMTIVGTKTKHGLCSLECPPGHDPDQYARTIEHIHEKVSEASKKHFNWLMMKMAEEMGEYVVLGGKKFFTLYEYEAVYGSPYDIP